MTPGLLRDVAAAIADGRPIDWAAFGSATPAGGGNLASSARIVERVAQVHASLPPTSTFSLNLFQSLQGVSLPGDSDSPTEPPVTWGPLSIVRRVGRGTFGDVYQAREVRLNRTVALKLLRRKDRRESTVIEEGQLMARVRHPHVVTVFGAERIEGRVGLWMQFLEGPTLAQEVAARGPFPPTEVALVGIQLAQALAAVHRAGLLHRDVKAQNAMRDAEGRVLLTDFGTGCELTEPGLDGGRDLAGTPLYIAQEVLAGAPASVASDVYSVGVLLFYLATGSFPVRARSLRELREAHARRERSQVRSTQPGVPKRLAAVIGRATDPDPARRFASAADLETALGAATRSRMPRLAWLAVAAIAVAVLIGVVARSPSPPVAPAVPQLQARDFVLVTTLDNRTADPLLDGTLEYVLARELSSSSFMNVVSPGRVEDLLLLMRRPIGTPVDAVVGREIALRDGEIRAVIVPRVLQVNGVYSVSADVLNPADGAIVGSVADHDVAATELLPAMQRLSVALRRRLGESLPATEAARAGLPKVTTPSLRALKAYAQVASVIDDGRRHDLVLAEQRLRETLREDPDFASAHMKLALVLRLQRRLPEALRVIERAVALSDRVSEIERLVNIGELAFIRGSMLSVSDERTAFFERSAAAFEAALQLDPTHEQALVCLANIYRGHLRRPSVAATTRLANLRPHDAGWQNAAAHALLAQRPDDRAAARPYVLRAQRLGFDVPGNAASVGWARAFEAYDAWLRNDAPEALRLADRLVRDVRRSSEADAAPVVWLMSCIYLTLGRLDAASEIVLMSPPQMRRQLTVRVALEREDPRAIRELVDREYPSNEFSTVTTALIASGQLDKARQGIAFMKRNPDQYSRWLTLSEGSLALVEGRTRAALGHLERLPSPRDPRESLTLAQALAGGGRVKDAIAELEDLSRRRAEMVIQGANLAWHWLHAQEALAELYRRADRDADADAVEAELRKLLEVADDDHPIKRRLMAHAASQ